jgi:sterol-4alpha-carboxylate 3-dehydrogenase (decarboxylating)
MTGLYQVYERGQTHFQIGDNNNLFDWTYVTNVAHAHLLAADKLAQESIPPSLDVALPSIDLTTGKQPIPTSNSRPLGPYVTLPPNAEKIQENFISSTPVGPPRPVKRTRFDPLSTNALARADPDHDPLAVAGNVFFITNGEPVYFWDFMRCVWHALDESNPSPPAKKRRIVFPKALGMALAGAAEWWGWLTGRESAFTRFRVQFSCATRWHNIEKARRVLGYEPQIGIEEGVKKMVEVSSFPC